MPLPNVTTKMPPNNVTTQRHYLMPLPKCNYTMSLPNATAGSLICSGQKSCPTVFIIPSQLLGVTTVTAVCLLFLMMSAHVISAPSILYEQDDVIDSKPEADMTDFQIATFVTATETAVKHIL